MKGAEDRGEAGEWIRTRGPGVRWGLGGPGGRGGGGGGGGGLELGGGGGVGGWLGGGPGGGGVGLGVGSAARLLGCSAAQPLKSGPAPAGSLAAWHLLPSRPGTRRRAVPAHPAI